VPTIERNNISLKTPLAILKEQAHFLGEQTNNLVQAEVSQIEIEDSLIYHCLRQ
jgi:hypothetical protein